MLPDASIACRRKEVKLDGMIQFNSTSAAGARKDDFRKALDQRNRYWTTCVILA
jgi:hypothetical protein